MTLLPISLVFCVFTDHIHCPVTRRARLLARTQQGQMPPPSHAGVGGGGQSQTCEQQSPRTPGTRELKPSSVCW